MDAAYTSTARAGLGQDDLHQDLLDNLFFVQGKFSEVATRNDWYLALAYTIRDRLMDRWVHSARLYWQEKRRTVCYFSAEYLLGPQLGTGLLDLGIEDAVRNALRQEGLALEDLIEHEEEPGLGNGGLGRLAACFMESLATLGVPAIGYGIRYEFGIFDQLIVNGWQQEIADSWLRLGNPWEIARPELAYEIHFGGRTETYVDETGRYRVNWIPGERVRGIPFDTPIVGFRNGIANLLRLWKAAAPKDFDFQAFNAGNYYGAVEENIRSENITKVLYPNDDLAQGRELRLKQQYFFVSCSLQDMIRLFLQRETGIRNFHGKFAIQLNDTHPVLAIPELMRLLVDRHSLDWETAWKITQQVFGYTNHTLLPEALERWPVDLLTRLLPRPMEIIYEINRRFLDEVRLRYPGDGDLVRRLSLIEETGERRVRMAYLAAVGSHAINGVAALHTRLLASDVLPDFYALTPEKFSNKTNGVTPRRFMVLINPRLSTLISEAIGEGWIIDLDQLRRLEPLATDAAFQEKWRAVKLANKTDLAVFIKKTTDVVVDPQSLFDVQVKRIHEYKRQHLNVLQAITLYNRVLENPSLELVPMTVILAGKAAPGYVMAKLIVKLANAVGETINNDPRVKGRLKMVFIPDFNVKNAQRIYPAAELSEQISTAGKEASGTGNMKLMMNGAVTIGTLDGANIEIREEAGEENFFLFGLRADEVSRMFREGYRPYGFYESNAELKKAIDAIESGVFSPDDPGRFRLLVDSLKTHDPFAVLADYASYLKCKEEAVAAYADGSRWTRMSILNTARSGKFSSDRTIREYCEEIWGLPVKAS